MKPTYPRLPDAELEVMKALWALGDYPAHTGDIAQKLDKSWKAPTLLKLLSRLEERGFVAGTKEGRANAYTPLVQEADYLASESRSFLERLHGGNGRSERRSLSASGAGRQDASLPHLRWRDFEIRGAPDR